MDSDVSKEIKKLQPSNFVTKVFKWMGIWSFPDKKIWNLIYKIYSFLLLLVFPFAFTIAMFINAITIRNLNETTESLYMCLTMTSMLGKISTVLVKGKEIRELIEKLKDDKLTKIRTNEESEEFVLNYKLFNRSRNTFLIFCALCITSGFLNPLFEKKREFPFPAWFPFNWKENDKIYLIFYLYEVIAMTISCLTNATLDIFFAYLFFQLSMYLRLIGIRLKNIGWYINGKESQKFTSRKIDHFIDCRVPSENLLNSEDLNLCELIENIKLHQEIIQMKEQVDTIISVPIFIQLNTSTFVICFTAYQLVTISIVDEAGRFLLYFCFIVGILIQLLLPCYFGDLLTQRNNALTNEIYNSNWIDCSLTFRKTMIIFMEFLKRPIIVKAGILFKIGLRSFTAVINNSYNLFALLLNMDKRRK